MLRSDFPKGKLRECFIVGEKTGVELTKKKKIIKRPLSKSIGDRCPYQDPYEGNAWAEGLIFGFEFAGGKIMESVDNPEEFENEKYEHEAMWDAID